MLFHSVKIKYTLKANVLALGILDCYYYNLKFAV